MQRAKDIIDHGRVDLSSGFFIYNLFAWLVFTGVCTYAIYSLNFSPKPVDENKPVLFYTAVFLILLPVCICFLFLTIVRLKIRFYKSDATIEKKALAIEQVAAGNEWRLIRAEQNYYLFSESGPFGSNFTFAFNEGGFYINCYPSYITLSAVGTSKRDTDKIYEDLRVRLRS